MFQWIMDMCRDTIGRLQAPGLPIPSIIALEY